MVYRITFLLRSTLPPNNKVCKRFSCETTATCVVGTSEKGNAALLERRRNCPDRRKLIASFSIFSNCDFLNLFQNHCFPAFNNFKTRWLAVLTVILQRIIQRSLTVKIFHCQTCPCCKETSYTTFVATRCCKLKLRTVTVILTFHVLPSLIRRWVKWTDLYDPAKKTGVRPWAFLASRLAFKS